MFGVPCALHHKVGGGAFDLPKIVIGQFDIYRFKVLCQARQLGRARDRNDPRLTHEQPRERNLSWGRLLAGCDPGKRIQQGQIRFASLRRKARNGVADVIALTERGVLVDLAGEKSLCPAGCKKRSRFRVARGLGAPPLLGVSTTANIHSAPPRPGWTVCARRIV